MRGGRVIAEGIQKVRWELVVTPFGLAGKRAVSHVKILLIHRPIVAMVISIVLVLVGALTIVVLPIAQFPNIAPPEIQVLATYVGAGCADAGQAVATPIEQQNERCGHMNYMYSLTRPAAHDQSHVDFDVKTDPNNDFILAQAGRPRPLRTSTDVRTTASLFANPSPRH